jgi:hypothetical protein
MSVIAVIANSAHGSARRQSGAEIPAAPGSDGAGAPARTSSSEMRASPVSRKTLFRIFLQAALQQNANPNGCLRRELRPIRLRADHRRQCVRHRLAGERNLARQHLVQHAAERPMSVRRSTGLALAYSGDMYAAVPSNTPCIVAIWLIVGELAMSIDDASPSMAFAKPKSSTFTASSLVTLTFAGFKSR